MILSKEIVFMIGLLQSNHDQHQIDRSCLETNLARFKGAFYVCPQTVLQIYDDIQNEDLVGDKRIKRPRINQLLLALRFLKQYPTKEQLAGYGKCTEKTGLVRVWKYIQAIQELKETKIVWIFEDNATYDEMYIATVDGVHFRVYEPRQDPSTKWYSQKYKKAGLSYEIAVAVHHNRIVWANGPFPAGENDKSIFDKPGGLGSKIKEGQVCIGDQGYTGTDKISTRNSLDSAGNKDLKRRAKARQETVNSRLKNFRILKDTFRTTGTLRLPRHKAAFESCLVLIQYELENGSAFFKV